MTTYSNPAEYGDESSRRAGATDTPATAVPYGQGLQFHYSHAALGVAVLGVALSTLPIGGAAVAFAGCALIWLGLYLFMRQSAKTIRWFATPMVAVFAWFVIVSLSGSIARWTPAADAVAASRAESTQAVVTGADLHADVRLTGAQFLLTNSGKQPLTGAVLTVKGSDGDAYTTRMDRVEAGRTAVIQLPRFAAADGHPFRMATTKVQSLTIEARVNGTDSGTYTLRWR